MGILENYSKMEVLKIGILKNCLRMKFLKIIWELFLQNYIWKLQFLKIGILKKLFKNGSFENG